MYTVFKTKHSLRFGRFPKNKDYNAISQSLVSRTRVSLQLEDEILS